MPSGAHKKPFRWTDVFVRPSLAWPVWAIACAALTASAGSIGGTLDPLTALLLTIDTHVQAGWPAVLLLLAAIGFGRGIWRGAVLSRGLCPGLYSDLRSVSPAVGVAMMLFVIVTLGTAGLFSPALVWVLVALGLSVLIADVAHLVRQPPAARRRALGPPPGWLWVGLPGIAVLLVAAASPPGVLWASEYAGYDVLSYHLQLPKEWVELGHTSPVEHNVYSFLPGAIEQGYAAVLLLRGASSGDPLAGGGAGLAAAHTLHAGITILAAGAVSVLTRRLAIAGGVDRRGVSIAGAFAGGVTLCTPWTIVVGSLAYNEMGVVLIGAGSMLIACRRGSDRSHAAALRAAVVGGLVAAACLVKPTALLFVGAPAGVLLLRFGRLRHWPAMIAAGSLAGAVVLAVWLARNGLMTGNPVFPLATGVFGSGHWTAEQAGRFAAAHAFDGSIVDRLRLLVFADPTVAQGANGVARYRGTSNTQWLLAFPAGVAGIIALIAARRSRAIGVGLGMCMSAQLVAWLAFTHLQSRFLVPCLLVLGPSIGSGLGIATRGVRSSFVVIGVGVMLCLLQSGALWAVYSEQAGGEPNRALGAPPAVFMGEPYSIDLGRVSPIAYINHETPSDATVLLVGDATPLYIRRRTVYATVWDRPPILDLAAHRPVFVLINDAELARLRNSGYLHEELTGESLDKIVRTLRPVRAWPEIGVRLYRVPSQETP